MTLLRNEVDVRVLPQSGNQANKKHASQQCIQYDSIPKKWLVLINVNEYIERKKLGNEVLLMIILEKR